MSRDTAYNSGFNYGYGYNDYDHYPGDDHALETFHRRDVEALGDAFLGLQEEGSPAIRLDDVLAVYDDVQALHDKVGLRPATLEAVIEARRDNRWVAGPLSVDVGNKRLAFWFDSRYMHDHFGTVYALDHRTMAAEYNPELSVLTGVGADVAREFIMRELRRAMSGQSTDARFYTHRLLIDGTSGYAAYKQVPVAVSNVQPPESREAEGDQPTTVRPPVSRRSNRQRAQHEETDVGYYTGNAGQLLSN